MNAAGECRPPERISALPCLPCGRSLRSCRQKVRAVFFGGALQGRSEAAGRGRPCCRRGPRCSALARAGGTAMLRQALFAEYPAFFLCFRCTLRFFLGGGALFAALSVQVPLPQGFSVLSALESPGLSYVAFFPERGIRGGVSFSGIHALLPAGTDGHS